MISVLSIDVVVFPYDRHDRLRNYWDDRDDYMKTRLKGKMEINEYDNTPTSGAENIAENIPCSNSRHMTV